MTSYPMYDSIFQFLIFHSKLFKTAYFVAFLYPHQKNDLTLSNIYNFLCPRKLRPLY